MSQMSTSVGNRWRESHRQERALGVHAVEVWAAADPGDSSGGIEYLAGRPNTGRFASCLEERAVESVSAPRRATIAPVDEPLALEAADLSLTHGLAMADSLVYATARRFGTTLVTGEGLGDAVVVR
jgi:PIN domain